MGFWIYFFQILLWYGPVDSLSSYPSPFCSGTILLLWVVFATPCCCIRRVFFLSSFYESHGLLKNKTKTKNLLSSKEICVINAVAIHL
jgi:hypothetical protein